MRGSCWLGKLLSQDILEWDLSKGSYIMRIRMFYYAAAGTTFALTEMPWACSQAEDGCSCSLFLQFIHRDKELFPRPQDYLCPQRALKKLPSLNTPLLPSVQCTHDLFLLFFSGKNRGDLATLFATGIPGRRGCTFKNNSSLPWGHLAKWLKQSL